MGKIPPQALDIEEAVLGICMLYPDAIFELRLQPQMFYRESHQLIYAAMLEISKKGICDVLTVTNHLRNQGELDRIGGPIYITKLIGNVFSDQMAPNYALILREKFIRREYIRLSQEIQNLAFDDSQDLADVIEFTESGLLRSVISPRSAKRTPASFDRPGDRGGEKDHEQREEADRDPYRLHEDRPHHRRLAGRGADNNCSQAQHGKDGHGHQPRPERSQAKVRHRAFQPGNGQGKIATRIIAYASGYSNIQIRNAEVDLETIIDKSLDVSSYNIWIDDTPALSLFELRSKIKKLIVKKGIRMAIVDYLQLMRGEGKSREEEVSSISRGLKRMALEFGIPIIALAQLNRKVEERREKRPMLSDLRESGSIEQDADVVWLLWRPAYYDIPTVVDEERNEVSSDGLMVIDIAKNRNGATGDFNLWHNEPMTVIQDEEPKLQNLPY